MHELFEDPAAMFVVLKLVVAGAGGGKQNDVSGLSGMRSDFDGALEGSGLLDGHAAGDLFFNFAGRSANQKSEDGFVAKRRLQQGVVTAFVFASQNNQDAARKRVERFRGGVHVGGFRIVVKTYPANFRDEFQAMLDPGE